MSIWSVTLEIIGTFIFVVVLLFAFFNNDLDVIVGWLVRAAIFVVVIVILWVVYNLVR